MILIINTGACSSRERVLLFISLLSVSLSLSLLFSSVLLSYFSCLLALGFLQSRVEGQPVRQQLRWWPESKGKNTALMNYMGCTVVISYRVPLGFDAANLRREDGFACARENTVHYRYGLCFASFASVIEYGTPWDVPYGASVNLLKNIITAAPSKPTRVIDDLHW